MDVYPVLFIIFDVHENSGQVQQTEHVFDNINLARRFAQARTKDLTKGWHREAVEYKSTARIW